jgi:hypothetical protein
MKVSEKKRPNQRTQKPKQRPKNQEAKNKGKQAKAKSKQGNEAKPSQEKDSKERTNSNNNPTADTLRTPPVRAWAAVW